MYQLAGTYALLAEKDGVEFRLNTELTKEYAYKGNKVTKQGIYCEDRDGKEQFVAGTTVICALGQRSRTKAAEELRDGAPYVAVVGDAAKVSTITNAVCWGYHAALDI